MTKARQNDCVWSPHAILEILSPSMQGLGVFFVHNVLISSNFYVPLSCVHYNSDDV